MTNCSADIVAIIARLLPAQLPSRASFVDFDAPRQLDLCVRHGRLRHMADAATPRRAGIALTGGPAINGRRAFTRCASPWCA
jgi:hypothetical protein